MSDAATPTKFRLGRIRPKVRRPVLRLAAYLDLAKAAASLPESTNYAAKASAALSRMYLNDREGDCVIAGKAHAVGVWTANKAGAAVVATDAEIQSAYTTICGPGDNGCVIADVLDYMKAHGMTLGGRVHTIDSYVEVDPRNPDEIRAAIYLFSGCPLGINLPAKWEQTGDGDLWDIPSGLGARIIGGHDVEAIDYNSTGVVVSTWGGTRTITWAALASGRYVEEAFAVLAPDQYGADKMAPCGLDLATLQADQAKLGGGVIPDVTPPGPIPTPTPIPAGLTLDRAIRAITDGVAAGSPYSGDNVPDEVTFAAVSALQSAWVSGAPR